MKDLIYKLGEIELQKLELDTLKRHLIEQINQSIEKGGTSEQGQKDSKKD